MGQPTKPTQLSIPPCTVYGDRYTAYWGCVWLHGRRVRSPCVRVWAAAQAERRLSSVRQSAAAAAGMWLATLYKC